MGGPATRRSNSVTGCGRAPHRGDFDLGPNISVAGTPSALLVVAVMADLVVAVAVTVMAEMVAVAPLALVVAVGAEEAVETSAEEVVLVLVVTAEDAVDLMA